MAQVQIKDVLTSELLLICRTCPMQVLVQAYVRAARQLCNKSHWLLASVAGVATVADPLYTFGTDPFTEVIGVKSVAINEDLLGLDFEPITESSSGGWDTTRADDVPEFYTYVPEGMIALYPTPDLAYPLRTIIEVQPKRDAVSIDETLVVSWDYALQAGALAWLLDLPRTPWMDKNEANKQFLIFRGQMNQATSSAQRGYNAGASSSVSGASGAVRTSILPI
jgi:hypothetical protein